MHVTAQGLRLRNDLYCVEWDVKLYYTYIYKYTRLKAKYGNSGSYSASQFKVVGLQMSY